MEIGWGARIHWHPTPQERYVMSCSAAGLITLTVLMLIFWVLKMYDAFTVVLGLTALSALVVIILRVFTIMFG